MGKDEFDCCIAWGVGGKDCPRVIHVGAKVRALHTLHTHASVQLGHAHSQASHGAHAHPSYGHSHHSTRINTSPSATDAHRPSSHASHHGPSVLKPSIRLHTSNWRALEAAHTGRLKATRDWLVETTSVVARYVHTSTPIVVTATTVASIAARATIKGL